MSNTSYYLYQKYIKYGSQDWIPVYPAEYAISGDVGQNPVIKQENDPNCGYHDAIYRWYTLPIAEDFVCSGGNKYYEEIYQVSYDNGFNWENVVPEQTRQGALYEEHSDDCILYRWVNMDISTDWICEGTSKYYKQKKQWKYTDSSTWQDVTPAEYQIGALYEEESVDCGYVPSGYSAQYLTFIPVSGSSTFKFTERTVSYSLDSGSTWATLSPYTDSPTVNQGDKIMWKAELSPDYNSHGIGRFSSTEKFVVEGNAMSLLYGDNFSGKTSISEKGSGYTFSSLFSGCTGVTSAENLVLPATELIYNCYLLMFQDCTSLVKAPKLPALTLAHGCYDNMFAGCSSLTTAPELPATVMYEECYRDMFEGCSSLTTAPELPATTLANYCYQNMFSGCTSLTTAPSVLPAATLEDFCYHSMFKGCSSLTTAPVLPSKTLVNRCYGGMFRNCSSLNSITCLATDISASYCTDWWVNGVASTGTFTKASSMTGWTTGNNGIPTNWTVQNV